MGTILEFAFLDVIVIIVVLLVIIIVIVIIVVIIIVVFIIIIIVVVVFVIVVFVIIVIIIVGIFFIIIVIVVVIIIFVIFDIFCVLGNFERKLVHFNLNHGFENILNLVKSISRINFCHNLLVFSISVIECGFLNSPIQSKGEIHRQK